MYYFIVMLVFIGFRGTSLTEQIPIRDHICTISTWELFGQIYVVDISPDGEKLAVTDEQGIWIVDLQTDENILIPGRFSTVAFSPDGQLLLTNTLQLWDVQTGEKVRDFDEHTSRVLSVTFSPNGERFLSGSWGVNSALQLWDVETGEVVSAFDWIDQCEPCSRIDGVWSVSFSPDGQMVAGGSTDGTVQVWDVSTGELLHIFSGEYSIIWSVDFSPDGETILSASSGGIRLWDVVTGRHIHTFDPYDDVAVLDAVFSPNGEQIISGSRDGTIHVWDVASREALFAMKIEDVPLGGIEVSSDGEMLVTASVDAVRIWDVDCLMSSAN